MLSPYFASHSGHLDKEMQSRSYFTTYPKVVSWIYCKALFSQTASSALWQRSQADADLPCGVLVNGYQEIIWEKKN